MRRLATILVLIGFILGVASGPIFYWQNVWAAIWLAVGLAGWALLYHRRSRYVLLVTLFLIAVVLGNLRFSVGQTRSSNDVSQLRGDLVTLSGVVITDPQPSGERVQFIVRVTGAENDPDTIGKILVTVRAQPVYEYGNSIRLSGKLVVPMNRGSFDYVGYLARFGIYSTMDYPDIEIIRPFVGNPLLKGLYTVKHKLVHSIQSTLPEPAAALLSGLLFGIKGDFSDQSMNDFNRVGLTHIIALSGFNITIIAAGLLWLLQFLPLSWRYGSASIVIILFVLMTGASPSVTRAAIMGILVLFAGLTGRLADSGIALLLAAVAMLLSNPQILYHDVGFQLSFAATAGIIFLSPIFYGVFRRFPVWLNGYLAPTLAALTFSTPLLVYQFERLSLIAPLANLLVLPVIPLAMGAGFAAVILSLIYLPIGIIFGLIAAWPLNYIVGVADHLSRLPAASIGFKVSSVWLVLAAYAILGLGLIWGRRHAYQAPYRLAALSAPR